MRGFHEDKTRAFKLANLQACRKNWPLDRIKRRAGAQADLAKMDQDVSAACDTPVKTWVDWASIRLKPLFRSPLRSRPRLPARVRCNANSRQP
jgi:hypothetical protein